MIEPIIDEQQPVAPKIPGKTIADQHRASNPVNSAWVSANAGSGKTFVLAQRVVRLMLNGVAPSKILCLTFTKAAAAEMSNRVFRQLSDWSRMDDAQLREQLHNTGEINPSQKKLRTARLLFTRALESPGGLKIQTIHAFCEALLHQFTLEANTSGHFEVMDDFAQLSLLTEARQKTMEATLQNPELAEAISSAMQYGSDQAIENGLQAIIYDRQKFQNWIGANDLDIGKAIAALGAALGVDTHEDEPVLAQRLLDSLPISEPVFKEIGLVASHLDYKECRRVSALISAYQQQTSPARKFDLRLALYQTQNKSFLKGLPGVKALYDEMARAKELFESELEAIKQASDYYQNWKMLAGSLGLFKLADSVLQNYGHQKKFRGLLDYNDLIDRAANLLTRSDVRQWIQFKLDQGIDHVLVDEAQDTSPTQWEIINAIIEEFFAGTSANLVNNDILTGKTIFAVGDQKQSIYSFQGAEPEMFSHQKVSLSKKAKDAQSPFADVKLPISFRSTRDVLSAVDKVFENPLFAKGLQGEDEPVIHEPIRESDPGEVEIWPMFKSLKTESQKHWLLPVDHISEEHPTSRLAKQIAATVKQWIDNGKFLPGQGRKITYGDILILVRKRDRFASAITRELKQAGLSVAGADRLNLVTHIAIEDLISLTKWALFPEDDLSLAEVLKSPLFDFSEDDLFEISIREQSDTLWQSLCKKGLEGNSPHFSHVQSQLIYLQNLATTVPPYEFFSEILAVNSGRKKLRARLGNEVDDVLDAFLLEALNHTTNGGTGLQQFIHALETASPDIKREMDLQKDEVRVMTIHSAKGLEAPIVFLVDPGSPAFNPNHRPAVLKTDIIEPYPAFLWQPAKENETKHTAKLNEKIKDKAEEEYRRLLYVGMTRAEDKLVICGYSGRTSGKQTTWHEMVMSSLGEQCETFQMDEETAYRWTATHPSRKDRPQIAQQRTAVINVASLPDWATTPLAPEFKIIPPLSPSIAASNIEQRLRQHDQTNTSNAPLAENFALQKGNATHHLLQFLPNLETTNRAARARAYLAKTYSDWSDAQHQLVCDSVMAIIEGEQFQHLFSSQSRAEVSMTGVLDADGINRRINGQIDRLIITNSNIIIADYKTDRSVPEHEDQFSNSYIIQLAIYKNILEQIYPGKQVECLLLWTSIPKITPISAELLNSRFNLWLDKIKKLNI